MVLPVCTSTLNLPLTLSRAPARRIAIAPGVAAESAAPGVRKAARLPCATLTEPAPKARLCVDQYLWSRRSVGLSLLMLLSLRVPSIRSQTETPFGSATRPLATRSEFAGSMHLSGVILDMPRAATVLSGKPVRCVQVGGGTPCDGRSKPTNRDRIVAQCFAEESDIAATMVEGGFACDWIKFSGGHYSQGGKGKFCE
jgi:hypothetical protein